MTALTEKQESVKQAAKELFAAKPDWSTFYREILGLSGLVRQNFVTPEALAEFEQTEGLPRDHADGNAVAQAGPGHGPAGRAHPCNHRPHSQKPARGTIDQGARTFHQRQQALHLEIAAVHRPCEGADARAAPRADAPINRKKQARSGPVSRVLYPVRMPAGAMAISLGGRLLGPSSGLPGGR